MVVAGPNSMGELDEHYEFTDGYDGCIPADQVKQVHEFVVGRWEYLHHYAHSAAYCCNPRHHNKDHMAEESVKTDFMTVIQEFYPDEQDQADCLLEWQAYHSKKTQAWKEKLQWLHAMSMPGYEWWSLYGGHSPLIRPLAMKLLTLGQQVVVLALNANYI